MKNIFTPGDQKQISYLVKKEDVAAFQGEVIHAVCSTFALAREIEWATRQFVLDMREEHEEGIGTHLSIEHKGPAFISDTILIRSSIESIQGNEILCAFEASVNGRIIAIGKTGQKILSREKLLKMFAQPHE